jgi:hypothetical protein
MVPSHSFCNFQLQTLSPPPSRDGVKLSPLAELLYQPRMIDDECGAVSGMRIGRGNRSTKKKPVPDPTSHDLTWAWTWVVAVGSRWLTAELITLGTNTLRGQGRRFSCSLPHTDHCEGTKGWDLVKGLSTSDGMCVCLKCTVSVAYWPGLAWHSPHLSSRFFHNHSSRELYGTHKFVFKFNISTSKVYLFSIGTNNIHLSGICTINTVISRYIDDTWHVLQQILKFLQLSDMKVRFSYKLASALVLYKACHSK